MSVHIDDAVRLRADLSPDRSKYIELEGGGDLNMQYTPQGDMSLTGRYTFGWRHEIFAAYHPLEGVSVQSRQLCGLAREYYESYAKPKGYGTYACFCGRR